LATAAAWAVASSGDAIAVASAARPKRRLVMFVLMAAHGTACPRGKVKQSTILKIPSETAIVGTPVRALDGGT